LKRGLEKSEKEKQKRVYLFDDGELAFVRFAGV
jgi:hypothetical protein